MNRALLILVMMAAPPASAGDKYRTYTVSAGDSCWSIAERVFGSGKSYKLIHRHNNLGPLPHVLTPGQQIKLPGKGTSPDAKVGWTKDQVKAKKPSLPEWRRAQQDMGLWRLYKLATGDDSAAGIEFEDQSHLRMRENALLVIYGASAARSRSSRREKTRVVLEKGTLRGGLAALEAKTSPKPAKKEPPRLEVQTPSATIDMASTDAQVEVTEEKTSVVSVYEGKAAVKAQGVTVEVPKDHGTFVENKKAPAPPRPLPPPPTWESEDDLAILVPRGRLGGFEARWGLAKRAKRYRLEVARDVRFRQVLVDATVGAGVRKFAARELKPGSYFARVSSIDGHRLEGRASKVRAVQIMEVESSRLMAADNDVWEIVGLVRLGLTSAQAVDLEWALGDQPFTAATEPIRVGKPGRHTVRVRRVGATMASDFPIRVLAVEGAILAEDAADAGTTLDIAVSLSDEKQRPAMLPGVELFAHGIGPVTLHESTSAGAFTATLAVPEDHAGGPVTLEARWPGGPLGSYEVQITGKKAPEPEPEPAPVGFEWPLVPGGGEVLGSTPLPARSARPLSRIGVSLSLGGAGGDVRLGLGGELRLWKFGFEAELPIYEADLTADPVDGNELGDLRLGVRYVAYESDTWAVAPTVRVVLPTGGGDDRVQFEPGVLLDYSPLRSLALFTNQIVRVDTDFNDTRVGYAGIYGLTYRPLLWGAIGAEIDTLYQDDTFAPAASVAVWFHLGQVRLGLYSGWGLGDDGVALFGRYYGGVTFDFAFDGP